jgi:AraC-like DNA-binding protein
MAQEVVRFESLFSAPETQPERHGEQIPISADLGGPQSSGRDSYQALERKYRHRTYQAQELMVEKLLQGHFVQTEALERKLNMFDLHFDANRFMVVLVRPAEGSMSFADYASDIRDGGQVGLIASSIFSELLGEHYACYPTNLDDRYAFLLNFAEEDDDKVSTTVATVCREGVKFIKDNFCLNLKACVSGICEGLYPLRDLFRETDVVSGDANTVYTDGVCARAEGTMPDGLRRPEPSIEKQYLNALVTQDFQTALQLTLERVEAMYDQGGKGDLDRVKMFLNMRLHTTGNVLSMPMGALEGGEHGGDVFLHMDACNTLDEVEQALREIFAKLDSHFNTAPSDYTGTTGKVINLIAKRYMEPDLSVEMICDCLGKSRSYLSRMFKENTGMNLLDYLHTTRLGEAKKLLNETDLGISEIAAKVGYYSGWTLARVFKRYEGITPTAYRKAFCNTAEG